MCEEEGEKKVREIFSPMRVLWSSSKTTICRHHNGSVHQNNQPISTSLIFNKSFVTIAGRYSGFSCCSMLFFPKHWTKMTPLASFFLLSHKLRSVDVIYVFIVGRVWARESNYQQPRLSGTIFLQIFKEFTHKKYHSLFAASKIIFAILVSCILYAKQSLDYDIQEKRNARTVGSSILACTCAHKFACCALFSLLS